MEMAAACRAPVRVVAHRYCLDRVCGFRRQLEIRQGRKPCSGGSNQGVSVKDASEAGVLPKMNHPGLLLMLRPIGLALWAATPPNLQRGVLLCNSLVFRNKV